MLPVMLRCLLMTIFSHPMIIDNEIIYKLIKTRFHPLLQRPAISFDIHVKCGTILDRFMTFIKL